MFLTQRGPPLAAPLAPKMPRPPLSSPEENVCGYTSSRIRHDTVCTPSSGLRVVAHVLVRPFFEASTSHRPRPRYPTRENLEKNDFYHTRPLIIIFQTIEYDPREVPPRAYITFSTRHPNHSDLHADNLFEVRPTSTDLRRKSGRTHRDRVAWTTPVISKRMAISQFDSVRSLASTTLRNNCQNIF